MRKSLAVSAVVIAMLCTAPLFAASTTKGGMTLPIAGSFTDAAGTGQFVGTFFLREFGVSDNTLVARGILSGTLTDATGKALGSVMKPIELPVTVSGGDAAAMTANGLKGHISSTATCDILHLDLGPLNLDLLGLKVNLAQVVLDITAQSGAGNLLGNLLCAVTNLLNGTGSLLDIANLLNQILQILTGILG